MITTAWKAVIATTAVCGVVAGGMFWHGAHHPGRATTNGVIVADVSDSTAREQSSVIGLAETFFGKPRLTKGSTLTVITTGDDKTAGEPRLLARYEVPYSRRALEGKSGMAKKRQEILEDLGTRFQGARRTDRSPVFLAVKRGIEELRGSGCRPESACYLLVQTDGEELSEGTVKAALEGTGKIKGLPSPIPNEGISVSFCGFAETNDAGSGDASTKRVMHNARHDDRLRDVWQSLFTVPSTVTISPYCPKSETKGITKK